MPFVEQSDLRLLHVLSYQDPFSEYKERQEKKRAKKAEAEENARNEQPVRKVETEINWFGEKVGANRAAVTSMGGGVGKYLQLGSSVAKRPAPGPAVSVGTDESKKKRRIGFGEFDGW